MTTTSFALHIVAHDKLSLALATGVVLAAQEAKLTQLTPVISGVGLGAALALLLRQQPESTAAVLDSVKSFCCQQGSDWDLWVQRLRHPWDLLQPWQKASAPLLAQSWPLASKRSLFSLEPSQGVVGLVAASAKKPHRLYVFTNDPHWTRNETHVTQDLNLRFEPPRLALNTAELLACVTAQPDWSAVPLVTQDGTTEALCNPCSVDPYAAEVIDCLCLRYRLRMQSTAFWFVDAYSYTPHYDAAPTHIKTLRQLVHAKLTVRTTSTYDVKAVAARVLLPWDTSYADVTPPDWFDTLKQHYSTSWRLLDTDLFESAVNWGYLLAYYNYLPDLTPRACLPYPAARALGTSTLDALLYKR